MLLAAMLLLGASPAQLVQPASGGVAWSDDAAAKLATDLDALVATSPAVRGAHVGIVAEDTATGRVLYAHNADDEFQPASTLKLVVGSDALDELGPAYRFHTSIDFIGGDVILDPGWDPTLSIDDVKAAAVQLAARPDRTSIEAVDVKSDERDSSDDDSRARYPRGWTWDDFGEDYAPVVSRVSLEENLVHLLVTPGKTDGAPVTVTSTSDVEIMNPSNGSFCDQSKLAKIGVAVDAVTALAAADDTLDVRLDGRGCVELTGAMPLGASPESIDGSVADPVLYARSTLSDQLRSLGVKLAEPEPVPIFWPIARQPAHAYATIAHARKDYRTYRDVWTHDSQPLSTLLGPRFWVPSDNLFAEQLLRALAAWQNVPPYSGGLEIERKWLASVGVDPASVTLADGCGMSQYDRITPHDLVMILQHDWNGPNRQLVLDSLPVGGARGSIEGIAGTPAAGRVFAKTGSMMHVRGLAGYLATQNHGAVTFAFNVDDWNGDYPSLAALRAQVLSRIVTDQS